MEDMTETMDDGWTHPKIAKIWIRSRCSSLEATSPARDADGRRASISPSSLPGTPERYRAADRGFKSWVGSTSDLPHSS